MNKYFLFLVSVFFSFSVYSQQDSLVNYIDINERRQGYWLKIDEHGVKQYEGYFKNDVPVGEFLQFHANGRIKYRMFYNPEDQKDVHVTMYDIVGDLVAEGKYYDRKKDGVWTYYGAHDKVLMTEVYDNGVLNGTATVFWQTSNHNPAEIKNWKQGVKHGPWFWFYDGGSMRMKANYDQGKLDGDFIVYFFDGIEHIQGRYVQDKRDGVWNYYNEDGSLKLSLSYTLGRLVNEDEYARQETKYIDSVILQVDPSHPDPDMFLDDPERLLYQDMGIEMPLEYGPNPKQKKESFLKRIFTRRKNADMFVK